MRPVREGMCRFESYVDGSVTVEDVLLMNMYLDNELSNQQTIKEWLEDG